MKVVRLSALFAGGLYPPENIPGTHLCYRLSRPHGHNAAGRIMSMKNSNDIIRNRTFGLLGQCLNHLRHRMLRVRWTGRLFFTNYVLSNQWSKFLPRHICRCLPLHNDTEICRDSCTSMCKYGIAKTSRFL